MDRDFFSFIAHRSHTFCNPIADAKIDAATQMLELRDGQKLLDVGAGKFALPIRIAKEHRVACVGVECSTYFVDEARATLKTERLLGTVEVVHLDAGEFLLASPERRFDVVCCVGATHAVGGFESVLETAAERLVPGGRLLIADGFWRKPPEPEYLEQLGGTESELVSHAEHVERIARAGFIPVWACTASEDEWDAYEWRYSRNVEDFVRDNPGHPQAANLLERSRTWRRIVLRWGRDTLGFGMYVARRAE